jgi:hypothetical protein
VEEQTTFCSRCGAPQIKVAAPEISLSDQASTVALNPDAPDSVHPPLAPPPLPGGQIQWRKFWRIAFPLAAISGFLSVGRFGPLGIALFIAGLIIAINRYSRDHGGPLAPSQGAKLGAAMGCVAAGMILILGVGWLMLHFAEVRQQMLQSLQQSMGNNPDPRVQQIFHWASTDQGIWVSSLVSMVFSAAFGVMVSGCIGALTAFFARNKRF